mmetsp:Transcript_28136/g.87184  ORF Transcript_28136/g.87184 Transcript_28136/m.87184 type:complete len:328 (-) Transcript_28136:1664-2647(-)
MRMRSCVSACFVATSHLPHAAYSSVSRSLRFAWRRSFSASSSMPSDMASDACATSGSASCRASRSARAATASFMFARHTSATSMRPDETHMRARLLHTDASLIVLTFLYASSMLPMVLQYANCTSASRSFASSLAMPSKSRRRRCTCLWSLGLGPVALHRMRFGTVTPATHTMSLGSGSWWCSMTPLGAAKKEHTCRDSRAAEGLSPSPSPSACRMLASPPASSLPGAAFSGAVSTASRRHSVSAGPPGAPRDDGRFQQTSTGVCPSCARSYDDTTSVSRSSTCTRVSGRPPAAGLRRKATFLPRALMRARLMTKGPWSAASVSSPG